MTTIKLALGRLLNLVDLERTMFDEIAYAACLAAGCSSFSRRRFAGFGVTPGRCGTVKLSI